MLTVGSLFAGIGGFDLGFSRADFRTLWQVEQDRFKRHILERHFPAAKRYEDIRKVGRDELERVDVICAGVPCQPISNAGKRLGEADERWLWPDTLRIVGEMDPRWVVLENPAAFVRRGLADVVGQLSEVGYDAEWAVVSAADMGAPHLRERVWVVAYPTGHGREPRWTEPARLFGTTRPSWCRGWPAEPDVGRVAHGLPNRAHRVDALGDSLVPQIAEWIGRRILEWEAVTC